MNDRILEALQYLPPWEWPENARDVLLKALRQEPGDDDDRLLAAALAGDSAMVDREFANALATILADNSAPDELRAQAAISLGPVLEEMDLADELDHRPIPAHDFQRIRWEMHALFLDDDTPKEVRRRILEASVRAPAPWHQDAIRKAYAGNDREWRLTAVFCMTYVQGFDDRILESLDDPDSEIRREAVCAAGNREVRGAWAKVAALLDSQDTEKSLLLAAIEAAVAIRPRHAVPRLLRLCDSEDEELVDAAHEALTLAELFASDDFEEDPANW